MIEAQGARNRVTGGTGISGLIALFLCILLLAVACSGGSDTVIPSDPTPSSIPSTPYAKEQLETWQDILSGGLREMDFRGYAGSGISVSTNTITIGMACAGFVEEAELLVDRLTAAHDIPRDAVAVEITGRAYHLPLPAPPYYFECVPAESWDQATGQYTPGFGGMYYGLEDNTIYVYLLDPSDEVAMEMALLEYGAEVVEQAEEVKAIQGRYTWEQLLEWWSLVTGEESPWRISQKTEDGQWKDLLPGVFPWSMDRRLNGLLIEVNLDANPDVVRDVNEWLSDIGVPEGAAIMGIWDYDLSEFVPLDN